jgi:DNA polymerase III psi subunit
MENSKAFVSLLISEPIYIIEKKPSEPDNNLIFPPAVSVTNTKEKNQDITKSQTITKKVLVYCEQKNTSDLSFLSKILLAVNIPDKDAHVTTFTTTDEQISSDKHIYFGANTISPQGPQYELFKSGNNQILLADSLTEIQKDVNKKKSLWSALQKMFL